ncbi:MAG: serine/threonine-protein kinase [Polyangiaceae bacterium]
MSKLELLPSGQQQVLGRYQLVGEIASGGMASVFLARLAGVGGFQRLVAIKRLHPHLAAERDFVEMFLDEARLAASIHHRNVVPILEIGTSEAGYYLVMEYIEGVTLARLMTQATVLQEPIPRSVLLRIVIDTLSGLHAAHELKGEGGVHLGVVHRDCSPQNILVGVDGCTRITDFGIARARSRLHNTREGAMKGKLAYMAPEQSQGEDFDRRADVFSVATVMWEVLAGRRLFKGKTEAQTLRRLLHDPMPRLRDVVSDVPPALDEVCHKGLCRDPAGRYATAAEMADAVEAAARSAGIATEMVATERAVAALMEARYGKTVAEQREALREWMQATPTDLEGSGPDTHRGLGGPLGSEEPAVLSERQPPPRSAPSLKPGTGRGPNYQGGLASVALGSDDDDSSVTATAIRDSSDEPTEARPSLRSASTLMRQMGHPPPSSRASFASSNAEQEPTNIYDPPSSTGMTAERPTNITTYVHPTPVVHTDMVVPTQPESKVVRWVLAAVLVAALAAVAVVAIREPPRRLLASAFVPLLALPDDGEVPEPPAGEASAEPADEPPPSTEPEPTESAEPTQPEPTRPPPTRPPVVRPRPQPTPQPPTSPPPPPPPPPGGDDIDDLTNPYR